MVTLQDFRQARAKVTVYQQGQIIRASVATAIIQNIEKLKINSLKTQIVILVPRFLSSSTGPRTGTWKRGFIYLFIIYLFIYRFAQCTGERTIGHVAPYLVHPPNPTP